MGLSEKLTQTKNELESLISYANETTDAGDVRIGDAIRTLVEGYGNGDGSDIASGEVDLVGGQIRDNITHLFDTNIGIGKTFFIAFFYTANDPFYEELSNIGNRISLLYANSLFNGYSFFGTQSVVDGNGLSSDESIYSHYNTSTGDLYFTVKAWTQIPKATFKWFAL